MTRRRKMLLVVLALVLQVMAMSCRDKGRPTARPAPQSQPGGPPWVAPIRELACAAMVEGDETGDGFFGRTQGVDGVYHVWQWRDGTLEKMHAVEVPDDVYSVTVVSGIRYLGRAYKHQYASAHLVLASLATGAVVKEWAPPTAGEFLPLDHFGRSSNGDLAAVVFEEDVGGQAPGGDYLLNKRYRVGLIHLSTSKLHWVGRLSGHGGAAIRRIAVSDDGRYIAVGGWKNGVALVDAQARKVLWAARPPTEVSTGYVRFSSDGLTLYTAGSEGCVYTIETKTGKILSRWWASETGQSIYGHRTSCLAMSPDGAWMAVGTGPEGKVFLFNSKKPTKATVLNHGLRTILVVSFSPDSKYLASVAGGRIKIWEVGP